MPRPIPLRCAVVLPALNEEATIVETVRSFAKCLPEASIWVVDNASDDATARLATDEISRLHVTGGVLHERRRGKGHAVRRAFREIDADVYVLADADMTYPAERAHLLIEPVVQGVADMVVGDRMSGGDYQRENKRALHGFGNQLVRLLVNKAFGANLSDIMSGYRAFSRAFVKTYPIVVSGFEIETDMTLHALDKRLALIEVPISYRDRPSGSLSKLSTFRDGARVVFTFTTVLRYYRPLLFFGSAAVGVACLGLIAAIPVFDDWIRERYIHHVPLAILATGLELVAIVLAAVGLILDSIAHQEKRRFERELVAVSALSAGVARQADR
jgi:glycosyltransferase involved in cell wall biosynthesis